MVSVPALMVPVWSCLTRTRWFSMICCFLSSPDRSGEANRSRWPASRSDHLLPRSFATLYYAGVSPIYFSSPFPRYSPPGSSICRSRIVRPSSSSDTFAFPSSAAWGQQMPELQIRSCPGLQGVLSRSLRRRIFQGHFLFPLSVPECFSHGESLPFAFITLLVTLPRKQPAPPYLSQDVQLKSFFGSVGCLIFFQPTINRTDLSSSPSMTQHPAQGSLVG